MNNKTTLIILLLFHFSYSFCQEEKNHKLLLRLSPLALVDVYNGSNLKLGAEFMVFKQTTIGGDFGYYFHNFSGRLNIKGFNVLGEIKHYLKKESGLNGHYLALNAFYKEQEFDFIDHPIFSPSEQVRIHTEKFVGYVGLNYGYLFTKKRYTLDVFCGLGVRMKKVNSNYTTKDFSGFAEMRDSQASYFIFYPGKFGQPNVSVGLRLGFLIV